MKPVKNGREKAIKSAGNLKPHQSIENKKGEAAASPFCKSVKLPIIVSRDGLYKSGFQ